MFRITEDPSSGNLVQCLSAFINSELHTRTTGQDMLP